MTSTGKPFTAHGVPSPLELRDLALQLAEMAGRLSGSAITVAPGAPASPPGEEVRSVAARLIQQCDHRVVRAQASYAEGQYEFNDPLLDRLHAELLARGGEIRMLITGRLLNDEETVGRLTELAASGAQIRISPCELPTATIFDGEVGLIASGRNGPLTVIGDAEAAQAISLMHEAVWARAAEFGPAHAGWSEDESTALVLRAASQGYTDEKAARVLGLSVRTYRRHVAALLSQLDANSRFQAGVRAAQLGLIDIPA
ncbi:LuxR family transcriptional regulator [Streptacidiphilus sp. P02-A3a]|uniref:helix-turn-helix transcriptional regulator n=1 Tax=Streptacidiphilus sp. P02-A3a TaxID=2704468 RepID=UPI0015FD6CA9|nr:LuxR family transcriptional regulator [Streptacidiphilus sp. P02-A3a]QMU71823.1 LuxR family transcriptional regulator [Streptacidiphilus sp. P02-A3a]